MQSHFFVYSHLYVCVVLSEKFIKLKFVLNFLIWIIFLKYLIFTYKEIFPIFHASAYLICFFPSRASSDKDILKKFITCIRLFALSRNQVDCTPAAIKQLIKGNYFNLNVMPKRADIDRCLPG